MTNLRDITDIRMRFLAIWDDAAPFIFDNESAAIQPDGMWARFSVVPGASFRTTIGSDRYEQLGRIYLQIYLVKGQADGEAWRLLEAVGSGFREWRSDDYRIAFGTPEYSKNSETDLPVLVVSIRYIAQH